MSLYPFHVILVAAFLSLASAFFTSQPFLTHKTHLIKNGSLSQERGNLSRKSTAVFSTKPPRDMAYIPTNIMRQLENYRNIRNVGGTETVNDVYVRDPECDIFWFAGKVARCTGTVSLEQAISRQWSFIEEHACRLRVAELSRKFGTLEIWTAPADSELDVAYNRPNIQFQKMTKFPDYCVKEVKAVEIGFESEIYEEGEEGFRARRNEEGLPVNPEIKSPE